MHNRTTARLSPGRSPTINDHFPRRVPEPRRPRPALGTAGRVGGKEGRELQLLSSPLLSSEETKEKRRGRGTTQAASGTPPTGPNLSVARLPDSWESAKGSVSPFSLVCASGLVPLVRVQSRQWNYRCAVACHKEMPRGLSRFAASLIYLRAWSSSSAWCGHGRLGRHFVFVMEPSLVHYRLSLRPSSGPVLQSCATLRWLTAYQVIELSFFIPHHQWHSPSIPMVRRGRCSTRVTA